MNSIPLNHGLQALVDKEDVQVLSSYKWCAMKNRSGAWGAVTHKWQSASRSAKRIHMHRLIMACPDGMVVDHINGNRLDNRKANLRICTVEENNRNRKKHNGGTSRYKGVCRKVENSNSWTVYIAARGRSFYLGSYSTEKEAALVYDRAARRLHGEFARLNFPELSLSA